MVIDHEFKGATPAERSHWMQILSNAAPDDIPRLLAERRQQIESETMPVQRSSTDPAAVDAKAQQIILTEQRQPPQTAPPQPTQTETTTKPEEPLIPVSSVSESRTLFGGTRKELTAPVPVGLGVLNHSASPQDQSAPPESDERPAAGNGFISNVFDVFGVGGDRSLTEEERDAIDSIQPAGRRDEPVHADTSNEELKQGGFMDEESHQPMHAVYWQEDIDKLIALLETQVAQQSPGESVEEIEHYIRQHVALRMLYLIASRRPEALQAIPNIPRDEQEFWTQMFWALATTFDDEAMPNSTVRAAETVAQLRTAVRLRQSQAALQLEQSLFCQRIDGFGDYVPFRENRFEAGQSVLVYTEVKNFLSQATDEGDFRTVLRSSVTIRQDGMHGRTMFQQDLPPAEDRCQSRRSDYFHSYRIQIPSALDPGPYVLVLDVTDALSGQAGQTTMNFLVR
jgi:hypothetical protein